MLFRSALCAALLCACLCEHVVRGGFGIHAGSSLAEWGIGPATDPAARAWSAPDELFEYDVIMGTAGPLGLRLASDLAVTGVEGGDDGAADVSVAAAAGVRVRDVLVSVNGQLLAGLPLVEVTRRLREAALPKTLRFRPAVREVREQSAATNVTGGALVHAQKGAGGTESFVVSFHKGESAHGLLLSPELEVLGFEQGTAPDAEEGEEDAAEIFQVADVTLN